MAFEFHNQTVIVTGGTRGIGRGITEGFLKAGARVIALYRANQDAADALVKACAPYEDRLQLRRLDVSDYGLVEDFFKTLEKEGRVAEVLVHCAGVRRDAVAALMRSEDWRAVLATNLDGSFNVCKFGILNMMQNRYGRIILITSPGARFGFAGQGNYAASKAGQEGLMRSLSREVARKGITVNCCSPGFIDTDFIADLEEGQKETFRKMVPLFRFGTVQEVAHAVLFLASRESAYINGTTLEVTGGL